MKIDVLFGTETGNAEMLAEDIQSALESEHDVTCRDLADVDPAELDGESFAVIVCSTYGEGELPSSARPFAEKLDAGSYDLSALRFAMFGLGDAEYSKTFTHGSKTLAEKLQAKGAVQVGERVTHDASSGDAPEDVALPWITDIVAQVA
ncbi:flavodoxin domain-containing protein [Tianweitania sediminis]|uniref:Flavodoxin domain-containing protein n=1 Tax=Tianweitania sediminis TaxID=1502156 RepID=A0A8J7UH06_9HYPH|nr:flavodoxin domain-containing protein [Tianweitania sediminis]MBP0438709.1 flavodoxin domain-containing protein [Tianweitania sediminis]